MRYFIDAEFNGFGGALISLAAVPEDDAAAPFYEAVDCTDPSEWVRAHVLPVLQTTQRSIADVARLFSDYLADDPAPLLVADWPEDIAHAAALLTDGKGTRLFRAEIRFHLLPRSDFATEPTSRMPHNAYHDAVALREWVLAREVR
jgi:hypothetical protein